MTNSKVKVKVQYVQSISYSTLPVFLPARQHWRCFACYGGELKMAGYIYWIFMQSKADARPRQIPITWTCFLMACSISCVGVYVVLLAEKSFLKLNYSLT